MGEAKHARPQVGANRPGAKRKASALTKSSGALAALDPQRPDELISMNITTASLKAARDKFVEEQNNMGTDVKEKRPKRLVAISYRGWSTIVRSTATTTSTCAGRLPWWRVLVCSSA